MVINVINQPGKKGIKMSSIIMVQNNGIEEK